jgi:tripartite-type tricarboxylate transporter receptor subunit TctC
MIRVVMAALIGLATLASVSPQAHAQATKFPTKPMRIVVGFSAGGLADQIARLLGDYITRQTGQAVIVENRTGAAGTIAVDTVAKAPPDGYTIGVVIAGQLVINPFVQKAMPVNVLKDLTAVASVVDAPQVIAMSSQVPAKDIKEFVALAKANPGKYSYGSAGHGSFPHLSAAEFARIAGVDMVHVPYRGNAPAITDLIAGRVQIVSSSIGSLQAGVDSGKVRLLVTATAKRLPYLSDVPSSAEAGLKDYIMSSWVGVIAPARTPPALVARIHDLANGMLKDPATLKVLATTKLDPLMMSQSAFADFVKAEYAKWQKVVQTAGVKPR